MLLWNRIISTLWKRIASQYPPCRKQTTLYGTVLLHSLQTILRAGRTIWAFRWFHRGNILPIKFNQKYQDTFQITFILFQYSCFFLTNASKGSFLSSKGQSVSCSLENGLGVWCSDPQTPKDSWGSLLEPSTVAIQGLNYRTLILKYFSSPFLQHVGLRMQHWGAPGWLDWLRIKLLIWIQVVISWFLSSRSAWGSAADNVEPVWDSLSLPLSLPLMLSLSLFLQINKLKKKRMQISKLFFYVKKRRDPKFHCMTLNMNFSEPYRQRLVASLVSQSALHGFLCGKTVFVFVYGNLWPRSWKAWFQSYFW